MLDRGRLLAHCSVDGKHPAAERGRTPRDFAADSAEPEDADGLAADLPAHCARPAIRTVIKPVFPLSLIARGIDLTICRRALNDFRVILCLKMPEDEPKWRRRKEARPVEIVDAALEAFAEKGFAAAKLDDIARKAGSSKATLYLYFDTKEEIFRAVAQSAVAS